jgi:hypothetical protein
LSVKTIGVPQGASSLGFEFETDPLPDFTSGTAARSDFFPLFTAPGISTLLGSGNVPQKFVGNGAQIMIYGYLKIAAWMAVPIAALSYAKQVRLECDRQAVKWDVQHPPDLRWVMDHPQESLQRDREEAKHLHQLVWDLDH